MKKFLTVLGIILAILLAFNFLMIALSFHSIDPENIAKIEVRNGLTGNQFTITESREIHSVTDGIDGIHPYLWFGSPGGGYAYSLRFHDASGAAICDLTVAGKNTLISGKSLIFADCSVILSILEQLEAWHAALN